jgi:hypothetical protein
MTQSDDNSFCTDDRTLVAYLSLHQVIHTSMSVSGATVRWHYDDGTTLQDRLTEYQRREARVEPVEFSRQLTRISQGMHKFKANQENTAAA